MKDGRDFEVENLFQDFASSTLVAVENLEEEIKKAKKGNADINFLDERVSLINKNFIRLKRKISSIEKETTEKDTKQKDGAFLGFYNRFMKKT
jgi:hypothetical protein